MKNKQEKGIVMMVALVVLLLAIPTVMFLMHILQVQLKHAHREKKYFAAQDLPQNALVDYMRQFAQNTSINWMDLSQFNRPDAFYAAGFSTMTVTPDPARRMVEIFATGSFNPLGNASRPVQRRMRAVLGFSSDVLRYATLTGSIVSNANNRVNQDTYSMGNITVNGLNNIYNGDVVSGGNVVFSPSTIVNGNLYHAGNYNGAGTVNGLIFNYAPPVVWPNADLTYWVAQANDNAFTLNNAATYTFTANGNVQVDDLRGTTFVNTTAASGVVLVAPGRAVLIGNNNPASPIGKIRGHVTLVASTVTIINSLVYANMTNQSDAQDSFGIVALNPIQMIKNDLGADAMTVTATVWPYASGNLNCSLLVGNPMPAIGTGVVIRWLNAGPGGAGAAAFQLIGTSPTGTNRVCDRWNGNAHGGQLCLLNQGSLAFPNPVAISGLRDAQMSRFPPPGFPERCTILSYDESGR